ncbi:DUF3902 family protein [Heyndrickxia sporothermodurans]
MVGQKKATFSKIALLPLISSIIGFIISISFEGMAYWSPGMTWYWVGAYLSYIFAVLAIIFLALLGIKVTRLEQVNFVIVLKYLSSSLISIVLILVTMIWTTFIIIAWQSGV